MPESSTISGGATPKQNFGKTCRLGITGGLCSGKSIILKAFELEGMGTLDANRVAATLLQRDRKLSTELEQWLAAETNFDQYRKKRAPLSRMIPQFYLHPTLPESIRQFLENDVNTELKRFLYMPTGTPIRVVEDPLIIEKDHAHYYDEIWLVNAKPDEQTERLIARDGLKHLDATKAVALYCYPADSKRQVAHQVLSNYGDLAAFKTTYTSFISHLRARMAFSQRYS